MKRWAAALTVLLLVCGSGFGQKRQKYQEPTAALNFVVLRDYNGKPVRNAGVVMHSIVNNKQDKGGLELKTDAQGKANFDGVPYGKLRVQVLATGFQTFGADYDIDKPTVDITIKLKRPTDQYSIYNEHPDEKRNEKKNEDKKDDKPQ